MNWSEGPGAEVPPAVVTAMSTGPTVPAGAVALQAVVVEHDTAVPALAPNLAVVAPTTKPVPVMATAVPPTSGPAPGATAVTTGIAS